MPLRSLLKLCLLIIFSLQWLPGHCAEAGQTTPNTCLQCHATKQTGFGPAHAFAATNCISCHAGDDQANTQFDAHGGLIAFPGDLANSGRACGNCHSARVSSVSNNLMHDGRGIVRVTRQVISEVTGPNESVNFQSLGHGVADSMLRKQCASCHLGQTKTEHRHDVMRDRGGGCLACHVESYPDEAHPALTARVSDARCFGCHSRSGRISLSYAGLAEVDGSTESDAKPGLRLPDGRHIARLPADVHYLAGMSCIDCHTSIGLMGDAGDARHQRQAVDIACVDCHNNGGQGLGLSEWPAEFANMKNRVPFVTTAKTVFLTTGKNETPLWHIELRSDGAWLHTKITDRVLRIPRPDPTHHLQDDDHQRLTCAACHSQWAPQCFGCHMNYDPNGEQWDHVDRVVTAGRWHNERWDVRNELAALGVNESNQIELFVPGMIMTVTHPAWNEEKFIRMFAPLSPHTTGRSRSCESCHRSSEALGLGAGEITDVAGKAVFKAAHKLLRDGLPADAWTDIDNSQSGRTPAAGQRPLNKTEMKAVLDTPIP